GLREFGPKDQKRPARNIHGHPGQSLVHGQMDIAKARNACHIAKGQAQRLAKSDACILDRVMLVNVKIALSADFDVDERMPGELFEHMIEESDSRFYIGAARSIEIGLDLDGSFLSLARDGAFSHRLSRLSEAAF